MFSALIVCLVLSGSAGSAQIRGQSRPPSSPAGGIIQTSEEAAALLRKADEGIQRQDWKLAVDSLQRMVELPGEHVITADGNLYESARRHAHRRIASLPAPGLQAYRALHDGEASVLLNQALNRHDPATLRIIVDRYFCSSVGDKATVTLADWLIDEGRFAEASTLLQQVASVFPDSALPAWLVPARMAVCAAAMGQHQRARTLLDVAAGRNAADRNSSGKLSRPAAGRRNGDAMPPAKAEAISDYIAHAGPAGLVSETAAWPAALGGYARNGAMPLVEPTFQSQPWTVSLTTSEIQSTPTKVAEYAQRQHLIPVRQAVTDGRVLVIKGENELIGLDVDTFAPVWKTQARSRELARLTEPFEQPGQVIFIGGVAPASATEEEQLLRDALIPAMLHDWVGADVTLAMGMALTPEWSGERPSPVVGDMLRRFPAGMPGRDPTGGTYANSIAAYSLQDGSFLWRSDVTGRTRTRRSGEPGKPDSRPAPPPAPVVIGVPRPPREAEAQLEFLAAPVPVNGHLLAPCAMNGDVYAVVLDPASGKLVREIYLCGIGGSGLDPLAVLPPCVADGAVFIPTGQGLVFAVEASDWSVRWAARYERHAHVGGWLPTPPIVAADALLVAPADSDDLLCLDRGSGELRWRYPRGEALYPVAATDTHVWLCGRAAEMLDVETGHRVWSRPTPAPTGKAAVSGDRLYIPTIDGLTVLSALSGEALPAPAAAAGPDAPKLGNLLAWEGALYSVQPFAISKLPDLERGYQQALAAHQQEPVNTSKAIRLAWLELLRHEPASALAALGAFPADPATQPAADRREQSQVTRLRVRAILELVSARKLGDEESLSMLRQARQIAQAPEDAVASALALGDYLRDAMGRPLEACNEYLKLAFSPQGDQMIAAPSGTQRRARAVAVQHLAEALGPRKQNGPTVDRDALERAVAAACSAALQRGEPAWLWLSESAELGEQAHQGELATGRAAATELRFEQAEALLRGAVQSQDRRLAAESAARLAGIYLEPEELHQPMAALELIDRLEHKFPEVMLPADAAVPPAEGGPAEAPGGKTIAGREAAQALRRNLSEEVLRRHRRELAPPELAAIAKPTFNLNQNARPVAIRGPLPEPLCAQTLLLVNGRKLESHQPDGNLFWSAELRLLGDSAVETQLPLSIEGPMSRGDWSGRARALVSGQTLLVASEYGIHAIGLLTGRRLWSRAFDPPRMEGIDPAGSDACFWVYNGYVISVDRHRHLEVAPVSAGDRILWRAANADRRWAAVRARGGWIAAVDERLEHVDVYRLADGGYLGQCGFKQDVRGRLINIAMYDDVICGPAADDAVNASELAAPGVERWRVKLPGGLGQLFKPAPKLLAVANLTGGLQVVDPATGKTVMETKLSACAQGIEDGVLIGDILYVYGYQIRVGTPDQQRWALAAVRMRDGTVVWETAELPGRVFLSEELLSASANAVPLASFLPAGTPGAPRPGLLPQPGPPAGTVRMGLLDKATGKPLGEPILTPLTGGDTAATRIIDVQVRPGHVLVYAGSGCLDYPAPATSQQPESERVDAGMPAALPAGGARVR